MIQFERTTSASAPARTAASQSFPFLCATLIVQPRAGICFGTQTRVSLGLE